MSAMQLTPVAVDYDPFAEGELERVVPTTEPQREVWLAAKLDTEASLAYNESVSMRLRGPLDAAALEAALSQLVQRHDALRSTFGPEGDTFCVLENGATTLQRRDLSALGAQARQQAVDARLRHSVDEPFVLERGPLFRAELLKLAVDDHLLLLSAHHLVCDGWSWWVMVRELGALYAQQLGQGGGVDGPLCSYADYALGEAGHADSEQLREDEQYWLSRFPDQVAALDLPVDRPRPGRRSFASRREDYVLDAELVAALRKFGARRGASLFATLLAGFGAVVSRISGQRDVVVGIPAAGQSVDGHDSLVGHCVNLLPLRFDVDPAAGFSSLLDQSKENLLDAIEHQRYTFGTLLKKIDVSRDPSRLPLVSVMFNIDQALDQEREVFPGLALEFTTNPRSAENFELSINAVQAAGELRLECQYNRHLFEAATVRRWLSAYEQLLRGAVHSGDAAVSRLQLVDVAARMDLAALQPAPEPFPGERLMHEFFEQTCDRTPGRTALVCGEVALDYAELEARANRIAAFLRARGAGHGTLVGLSLDRGVDMLAALLGILKSGAGYVPLDPQFPPDRIAYMAGDAGLAALVTQGAHLGNFTGLQVPMLLMDTMREELDALPSARLPCDASSAQPESTAYVIYTSGSTGKPKGVEVPHRAVANFLTSMAREPGLQADDRLVAVTTLSFDIAVLELMLPLSVGAQVVLAERDTVLDGGAFMRLLERCEATVVQATPAMWRLLLDAGWKGRPGFKALCGGEPLPHDLAAQLLSRCDQLWNLYGPTETTVWSTAARIVADPSSAVPDIHIGRPILNTQVWILDEHGEPCPRGVPGEICIGGEGVTLGYLHRPELTAERFIADRFGDGYGQQDGEPARRPLYRTGDRGRWRNDGNLEHLGRLDFQVKVRGYRIELGDIESNLSSHPQVTRNLVLAREDRPGDVRLVAYVVLEAGAQADEAALLSHLRSALPDYMVPQHVVVLPAMPLLPNGKIDRKGLPAPDLSAHRSQDSQAIVAPRDALEAQVLAAMETVLGRGGLGVEDGFFAMGGHSLLAAKLCARLGRELDLAVPLRVLFEAPTAARLAAWLRTQLQVPVDAQAEAGRAITRRSDRTRAPMTLMQQRLWVLEQIAPGQVTYNTPSAHRLRGPIDLLAFDRAFAEMVRRQPSLRTSLQPDGEGAVQMVAEKLSFTLLPVEDLSGLGEEERMVTLMAALEAQTAVPFTLEEVPLFRARLYRLGPEDHVLYFMTHHAIWDGWSFDVFYEEMSALYQAYAAGEGSPLPELAIDYGDFAAWHAAWVDGPELAKQVNWWASHLAGELEPLQLPADRPRPARQSGAGGTDWVRVDRATTDSLRTVGGTVGATLFMTLLAAYYLLLHRLGGQRDLVVGLPVRNRGSEDLERVMGFFVNVLPLRMRIDPDQRFVDLVVEVRDAMAAALASPDVPFEHLVRELGVVRDPSRSPLYQALFSFQDVRGRRTRWGELEHEHLLLFQKGMGNDLGLWFLEHAEGLSGALGYNSDIFGEETITRFNYRFVALLQSLCADPEARVGEVGLLCAEDVSALEAWNATEADMPLARSLHGLIAAQARHAPGAVAIRQGDTVLDHAALDARATAIAAALQGRGVGPGALVGICLERTPDLLATMLAVLKAGAAYVPLDPVYPAERLRYMAEDAQLACAVSTGTLAEPLRLPAGKLLRLDADRAEIAALPGLIEAAEDPEAAAYVIYTSGSTGKPKGVRIPHRAVLNFLHSMAREPGLTSSDKLLAVTTTSFDIAVLELFGPLVVGAEVVLASREQAVDGEALSALARDSGATLMQATPATWRVLMDAGWQPPAGFRALCGGEPLPRDLAREMRSRGVEVWNMYGPTETTVWSTCCRVDGDAGVLPIGRPIANTTVWVLDAKGQACAPGVVGELCIGGAGLALDYLNRPELTAERFIEVRVPADARPQRLYRTGDRARWRLDGQLECLGRLDHQVKVRGHRIELGEIESVLAQHRDVLRAHAIVREDRPGDLRIVAYVVPCNEMRLDQTALLEHMRRQLPDYMIPQHVVALDELPLTPNGKIDRNALPRPMGEVAADHGARPEGALERLVAGQMAQVLGIDRIGADKDFFEMGGHSLLAVQLFQRLRQATRVNLPIGVLFSAPTVQGLAHAFRAAGAADQDDARPSHANADADPWAPLVPLQKGSSTYPLFLVHAVGGNILNYRALAKKLPRSLTVYGLQALGLDGNTPPLSSVEAMAERYVTEIQRVQPHGPYRLAGGSMGGIIAYEIAQRLVASGEQVGFLGLFDTAGGSDEGPSKARSRLTDTLKALTPSRLWNSATSRWRQMVLRLRVALIRSIGAELPHEVRYAEVHRVHYRAACKYRVRPYPGDLVVYRAEDQQGRFPDSPTLGWQGLVRHVEVVDVPGSHDDLVEAPELAGALSRVLEPSPLA